MVRQDPWSLMPRLQDEINRLFGNVQQNDSSSSATAGWDKTGSIRHDRRAGSSRTTARPSTSSIDAP
jgi:hypothetical protein